MSRRYIDMNSGYRNRNTYPKICDFVIELNSSYKNTAETSLDPIVLAFPYEMNLCSGGSTTTQIAMSVTSSTIVNFYRNSYLQIGLEIRKIIAYDNTTQIVTVDLPFSVAPPALTLYTIRKERPIEITPGVYDALTVNASPVNQIDMSGLPLTITGTNGERLRNLYVYVQNAVASPSYFERIRWGRLEPILVGGVWTGYCRVYTNNQVFPALPAGTDFQLMRFSYNNVRPLIYFGTEVGTNNPIKVNVRLCSLIMPNRNVLNGYGGTLQNYPHLYVAIYSEKGTTWNNPIIGNSPGSERSLFKCPITYLNDNTFLSLISSDMMQEIMFKPNDTLHLSIFLPNGEILDFERDPKDEIYSYGFPIESDQLTQIQAVFEVSMS